MFILDSLRGKDSCGLTTAGGNGVVEILRSTHSAEEFIDLPSYRKEMAKAQPVRFGHNRWATAGAVTVKNAHPFIEDNIVGQHNGTLVDQTLLPDHKDYQVDSQNIMHSIAKIGIEETWKLVDGAAALMWWDSSDDSFNLLRNYERPLWLALGKDGDSLYVASEKFMMLAAADRNNIQLEEPYELEVNTHLSINIDLRAKAKHLLTFTTNKLEACVSSYWDAWYNTHGYNKSKKPFALTGELVTATVKSKTHLQYAVYYDLSNANGTYVLEDYSNKLELEVGDEISSEVKMYYNSECYLNIMGCVKLNKPQLSLEYSSSELMSDKECAWCSAELTHEESISPSTCGELFCDSCKALADVSEYIKEA